jgi:hypothetical protein
VLSISLSTISDVIPFCSPKGALESFSLYLCFITLRCVIALIQQALSEVVMVVGIFRHEGGSLAGNDLFDMVVRMMLPQSLELKGMMDATKRS